jgi:hypothetical protein
MRHRAALTLVIAGLAGSLWAQSSGGSTLQHSELSAQVSGVFTAAAGGTPTTASRIAHHSAGLLLGYRIRFTRWEAIEFEYGYTRNGQAYTTPGTAPGTPAVNNLITTTMQEAIANEVVTTPKLLGFFQPFVLGGGGLVIFSPTGNTSGVVATTEHEAAINYGAGIDFHIGAVGARVEYQGLIFKIPNFNDPALTIDRYTHVAQPSVGLILTF